VTGSWSGWSVTGEPGLTRFLEFRRRSLQHTLSSRSAVPAASGTDLLGSGVLQDPRTGEPALDLPKIFGIPTLLLGKVLAASVSALST